MGRLFFFLAYMGLAVVVYSAEGTKEKEVLFDFNAGEQPLDEALNALSERSGVNVVAAFPGASGIKVSCDLKQVSAAGVVKALAEANALEIEDLQGTDNIIILDAKRRINRKFESEPFSEVIAEVCAKAYPNIICDPTVKGNVSLNAKDMPWPEAVRLAAAQSGAHLVRLAPDFYLLCGEPMKRNFEAAKKAKTVYLKKSGLEEVQPAWPSARFDFKAEEESLSKSLQRLQVHAGVQCSVGGDVGYEKYSCDFKKVSLRGAIKFMEYRFGVRADSQYSEKLSLNLFRPGNVTFAFDDGDFRDFALNSEHDLVVGSEVRGTLNIHCTGRSFLEVLDVASNALGFVVVTEPGNIIHINTPELATRTEDGLAGRVWSSDVPTVKYSHPRSANAEATFKEISRQAKVSIVLDDGIAFELGYRFSNTPWPYAVEAMAKAIGCVAETVEDGKMRIRKPIKKE